MNPLIAPGAPLFGAALASALVAVLGLMLAGRQREAAGLAAIPGGQRGRLLVGNVAALPLVALALLTAAAGGLQGVGRTLLVGGAVAIYLAVGLVAPRRALVARRHEARRLRLLTPGFLAFVRVALGSFESPLEIMRRYVARPAARLAPMQALVGEAIRECAEQRVRPFAALSAVARRHACVELIDMAEALAQAEAEGGRVDAVLQAQQATLELILQSEFKRTLRRRTIYLLLMVAVSLVVGILLNLLFVMVGSALIQLG